MAKRKRVRINKKRYFQVLGVTLALIVGVAAVCMGINYSKEQNQDDGSLVPVNKADGKLNVLLLGVDVEGLRTDAIMVASYDLKENKVNMLSIPRDTRMYVGTKYQKINAAHAIGGMTGKIAGPEGSIEAVTRLTGIPINYYVEFSFSAIDHFIDALGGVKFNVPDVEGEALNRPGLGMNYDDPTQNLHIHLKPGEQVLTGNQCQQLLRYRKSNPYNGKRVSYPDGDRGRIEVQQQFVKELVSQKLTPALILKIPDLYNQLTQDIKTNFTLNDVMKYIGNLKDFKSENIAAYNLPGESNGTDYGASYWICDLDETKELIQTVFGYDASKITIDAPDGSSKDKDKKKSKETAKPTKSPSKSGGDNDSKSTTTPKATKKPTSTPKPTVIDENEDEPTSTKSPKPTATASPTKKPSATDKPASTDKPSGSGSNSSGSSSKDDE